MTTQTTLTDAERIAIEADVKDLYEKSMVAMENVDIDYLVSTISDEYDLGSINNGFFFSSIDDWFDTIREMLSRLERQEILDRIEFKIAIMAPDVVVITGLQKLAVFHKGWHYFHWQLCTYIYLQ